MPGSTKQRKRKHRGKQTGAIDKRGKTSPKTRQEAATRARSGRGGGGDKRLQEPTWNSAIKRGLFFALLLFPISLLFNQPLRGAIILTVLAAGFYIPLGYYTDRLMYGRRMAKAQAEREARKQQKSD